MPGDVISDLFDGFAGNEDGHDYVLRGHEVRNEHAWIDGANVTTPDCFLVSPEAVLAIEIKFNATASLDQLAKYVALIAGEEISTGYREWSSLVFIYPSDAWARFLEETSMSSGALGADHFHLLKESAKNEKVKSLFASKPEVIVDALSRLSISCITWDEVYGKLNHLMDQLGDARGERTLFTLMEGLATEIKDHPLIKVGGE